MKTLQDIEAGDEVAVMHRYRAPQIIRVERATKTQIITEGGTRWRRDNGYRVGGRGYLDPRIEVVTDRHRNEAERHRLVSAIDHVWNRRRDTVGRLSLDTLRAVAEALEADPAVKEGW